MLELKKGDINHEKGKKSMADNADEFKSPIKQL
jgi:hypothetical protein